MWTNKKHGKREFVGMYARPKSGTRDRAFYLVALDEKPDAVKVFESWQAAKRLGWMKM